jgi:hypothetical protein
MLDWIMRTKTGAWIVALLAAAGLLAIGFGLASDYYEGELKRWQEKAGLAESRAIRLQAELGQSNQRQTLGSERPQGQSGPIKGQPETVDSELHLGQAMVVLEGRVVITLEKIDSAARKARVRVKVLGGREGVAIMGAGDNVSFRVDGTLYHLVLKQTLRSSATIALIPQ